MLPQIGNPKFRTATQSTTRDVGSSDSGGSHVKSICQAVCGVLKSSAAIARRRIVDPPFDFRADLGLRMSSSQMYLSRYSHRGSLEINTTETDSTARASILVCEIVFIRSLYLFLVILVYLTFRVELRKGGTKKTSMYCCPPHSHGMYGARLSDNVTVISCLINEHTFDVNAWHARPSHNLESQ